MVDIIRIEKINKYFEIGSTQLHVLRDVSFNINTNNFLIIYGPSGCGKSTLLHTIVGLEQPTSGKILIKGTDFYSKDNNERAHIRNKFFGIVYQTSYWIKSLNVIDNVAMPLFIRGTSLSESKYRAKQALEQVGMNSFSKQTPTELSGGQQQKVALARALITQPEVIIADEPTGNLDSKSAKEMIDILKMLNKDLNKAVVMVTHNMAYLGYASRTVSMKDGRISAKKDIKDIQDLISVIKPEE